MTKTFAASVLNDWLGEHGPYEVCMMRYCQVAMLEDSEQLSYNAHYAAFAVHARLLVDFLTGRQKKDDLKATVFVPGYQDTKREHLNKAMERLDQQVFHPTAKRTLLREDKVDLDDCIAIAAWIEIALASFLEALSSSAHKGKWASEKARNDLAIATTIKLSPTAPSASSAAPMSATVVSSTGPTKYLLVGKGTGK